MLITEGIKLEEELRRLNLNKPIGLDSETTGLDPHTAELRLLQLSDGEQTLTIDTRKVNRGLIKENYNQYLLAEKLKRFCITPSST